MIENADYIWALAFSGFKPLAIKLGLAAAVSPAAGSGNGNGSKLRSVATFGELVIAFFTLLAVGAGFVYSQIKDIQAAEHRLTLLEAQAAVADRYEADTRARQAVNEDRIKELEKQTALTIQSADQYKEQMRLEHAAIWGAVTHASTPAVSIYPQAAKPSVSVAPQPAPKKK